MWHFGRICESAIAGFHEKAGRCQASVMLFLRLLRLDLSLRMGWVMECPGRSVAEFHRRALRFHHPTHIQPRPDEAASANPDPDRPAFDPGSPDPASIRTLVGPDPGGPVQVEFLLSVSGAAICPTGSLGPARIPQSPRGRSSGQDGHGGLRISQPASAGNASHRCWLTHSLCSSTASFRATATTAFFRALLPPLSQSRRPQRWSAESGPFRLKI